MAPEVWNQSTCNQSWIPQVHERNKSLHSCYLLHGNDKVPAILSWWHEIIYIEVNIGCEAIILIPSQ